jgi:hypothetical protein
MPTPSVQSDAAAFAVFRDGLALDKPLYTRAEVQEMFDWSESSMDRVIRSGRLRVTDIGGHSTRVTRSDLAEFLWNQRRRQQPAQNFEPDDGSPRTPGRPRRNPRLAIQGVGNEA